jgi:hypothetical protein
MYRKQEFNKRAQSVLSSSQSSRDRDPLNRFHFQMKILAIFYVISTIFDWIIFVSGRAGVRN